MLTQNNWPTQQLSFSKKGKDWRKKHLDWADDKSYFNDSTVRKSVINKKINYDLVNGILNMEDLTIIINPENNSYQPIPERIPHYPIMNSKINVLRGEESKRKYDYKVIVTNPNAISEIEEAKLGEMNGLLQGLLKEKSGSEEEFNKGLEKLNEYSLYQWQDFREIRANALLNHYTKELSVPLKFGTGFLDALISGEEIYQCDIVGGEPTLDRINPLKIRALKSGYSNKIEDADIIVLEDFWSPGKIIDYFYDVLSETDMKKIEDYNLNSFTDADGVGEYDERKKFIKFGDGDIYNAGDKVIDTYALFTGYSASSNYIDDFGNIKVLRVYWKSKRKVKKVKSYDPQTGEEVFTFYPETYILNKDMGEEEFIYWLNEAWEGTKVGKDMYINMRPRLIQYNRLSNPSRCHFGIVGSIYNLNDNRPFSLVDIMKPYSYLYDVIHDRLNKAIASNWGRILELDLAMVPKGWSPEKWMYYAKQNHIAVKDSFNEGNIGASTGKLSGGMNNASRGVIDADTGNYIQQHINLLEFLKMEMSEVGGISKQREGQISNRETVGGVERATLQSSHITEWIFAIHDDVKKRTLECFLETAKIALKGRNKKFQYILPDYSLKTIDIMGDEFAECDYGLVVDSSVNTQDLTGKLDALAQAALQNQTLSFSTIMKIYTNTSLAETQRMIEKDEQSRMQRESEAFQKEQEALAQKTQLDAQQRESLLELQESMNIRDNETKILIAQMGMESAASGNLETSEPKEAPLDRDKLWEEIRQFDEKISLDRQKLLLEKEKQKADVELKNKDLAIKRTAKAKTT